MRTLLDARINRHLEVKTIKCALFTPTSGGSHDTFYTLRPEISLYSVATLIPRIRLASSAAEIANPDAPMRVGSQIKPLSCFLRVRLYLDNQDTIQGNGAADRAAIQPVLFVGYNKAAKSYEDLTANNWDATIDRFWRSGGKFISGSPFPTTDAPQGKFGFDGPFTGERRNFILGEPNSDLLHAYHYKAPQMIRPVGWYQNPVVEEGGGGFAGQFLTQKEYTFKIPMPSTLNYSNPSDEYPTNTMPFLACGFTYMNGAAPNEQAPLRIETALTFKFTDS
jgi:hypothetical protein